MQYEELSPSGNGHGGADLGRLQNVPVELAIEIGRTRMTIGEALALGPGSVVTVGRLAGDPVDLLVNGRVIARGEVVAIDEEWVADYGDSGVGRGWRRAGGPVAGGGGRCGRGRPRPPSPYATPGSSPAG